MVFKKLFVYYIIQRSITQFYQLTKCNVFNSYIFSTTKSLRTPSNLLVLNLAFSDFMMMVVQSPPMVINCFYETWALGPMMCDIYGMCGSFFGCTSIWTMCFIAFDR